MNRPTCEITADAIVAAGRLVLDFGQVDRGTYYPDGRTRESDTDHTVMLGLIACAIAAELYPDMNRGLIAQYAMVHDLPEVYAGDTPTLRKPTADAAEAKKRRERAAYDRIAREFGSTLPWLPDMIASYEQLGDREARFVKAVDKVIPKITHLLNRGVAVRAQGMTVAELADRYEAQVGEMAAYASDFPELLELRRVLVARLLSTLHAAARREMNRSAA